MTWTPVESTDVIAIGWQGAGTTNEEGVDDMGLGLGMDLGSLGLSDIGTMGVQFVKPPGSTYLYYGVPKSYYDEFLAAPSKGQYANRVLKRSSFPYDRIS